MDMRPSELDHITAVISLFRPGPMEYIPQFIKVLHNEAAPVYTHSLLEQILKETMGVCVYQEQVIQILTDVAGYSAGEADLVRRAISKKSQKTLDEHREIFARGARERSGLSLDEGYKIWAALDGFARYGFNRAHAADYAVIVAQTAYLKATYPVEYMAALLTVERHDTEKVGLLIAECRRMGIEVLPPNVNVSGHTFTIERLPAGRVSPKPVTAYPFPVAPGDAIRMGLDAIKNVGEGAVDLILQARASRQGTFKGLSDFVERVDLRLVNRRGLECLIKVGALEDFGPRGQLLAGVEAILQASSASHEAAEAGQLTLFGGEAAPVEVDLRALAAAAPPVSEKEALAWEKELVGVYVSAHPLQRMTVDLVNVVTHSASEITEELDKSAVVIAGMITDARPLTTKKGDTMAFVRLEDLQGAVEVTVFPQLYKDQRALWAADKIVIVGGKADLRNGRVSVVADWVQDYVEGVKVIEDTGTVGYRYAKGSAARSRPALRGEFASSQGDDPDETAPEENPFALEPPAWLDAPAPPAPGEATAGPGAPKQESPQAAGPASAPVLPTEALGEQEPVPSRTAEEVAGSRILTVSFRRTQSLETDRRRLGELVDLLVRYPGDDRFEIVIEAGRGARYHLDFPNNHTRVCTELLAALGAMGVRSSTVEGAA
jgi:DNA polymerase-3 subunit alpha